MKKSSAVLILLAIISFTGCKRNASEAQKALTTSDSTAVIEQVEKMYNEVFAYYNKRDFKTIKNGKKLAQGGLSVADGCRCLTKELDMIAC